MQYYKSPAINPAFMKAIMFNCCWNCFREVLIQLYDHSGGCGLWCYWTVLCCTEVFLLCIIINNNKNRFMRVCISCISFSYVQPLTWELMLLTKQVLILRNCNNLSVNVKCFRCQICVLLASDGWESTTKVSDVTALCPKHPLFTFSSRHWCLVDVT